MLRLSPRDIFACAWALPAPTASGADQPPRCGRRAAWSPCVAVRSGSPHCSSAPPRMLAPDWRNPSPRCRRGRGIRIYRPQTAGRLIDGDAAAIIARQMRCKVAAPMTGVQRCGYMRARFRWSGSGCWMKWLLSSAVSQVANALGRGVRHLWRPGRLLIEFDESSVLGCAGASVLAHVLLEKLAGGGPPSPRVRVGNPLGAGPMPRRASEPFAVA
jgi:hypothetical protein